ncbi:MAG: hypothetical protein Q7U54_18050 [Bacteroidales bacterium]|nr:hypothetical protein [Bacteroidales bacterium]
MSTYEPKGFKDIFDSPLGQDIWKYLNSQQAKERMELTSQLGHPAAEGIGDKLLEQLGEEVKVDRVKQATGHMIRFVMEELGYQLVQRSVKCRKKTEVYVYASRYEKV